jgi:hypothetical protein
MKAVFSSLYAGNLDFYSCLLKADQIIIDVHENYVKQSYRNRCEIYGANGKLALIIPIIRSSSTPMKEVKIDYDQNWQKIHWKSLESSYRSSPYFEFYEDKFIHLYEQKNIHYLVDFNMELLNIFLKLLDLDIELSYTDSYEKEIKNKLDQRSLIHPKMGTSQYYNENKYIQVFEEKMGFIPNLSIYDLVFNEGPAAVNILG